VLLVLLLLGLVALGGAIFAYSRIRYAQNTLLDLGHVPAFALTDADSTRVTDRDLEGKIWIADFFFTTCRGLCPTLTGRMADLQAPSPTTTISVSFRSPWIRITIRLRCSPPTPETTAPIGTAGSS